MDAEVKQILDVLSEYEQRHANARIEARRHNPVSIRIRIIDSDFLGMNRVEREPDVWKILKALPEEVLANITMVLLLTPEEAESSMANQEFDEPVVSPFR